MAVAQLLGGLGFALGGIFCIVTGIEKLSTGTNVALGVAFLIPGLLFAVFFGWVVVRCGRMRLEIGQTCVVNVGYFSTDVIQRAEIRDVVIGMRNLSGVAAIYLVTSDGSKVLVPSVGESEGRPSAVAAIKLSLAG